jgi:hypothetical protein
LKLFTTDADCEGDATVILECAQQGDPNAAGELLPLFKEEVGA